MQAASAQMYQQAGGAQPNAGQGFTGNNAGAGQQQQSNGKSDDNVQDADFEEVK
ncbi:chaperone protein DnaK [Prevotella sp. CAG:1124]|nr:chaperone protein DnaK [Prevotella sp. CAG:1124]